MYRAHLGNVTVPVPTPTLTKKCSVGFEPFILRISMYNAPAPPEQPVPEKLGEDADMHAVQTTSGPRTYVREASGK